MKCQSQFSEKKISKNIINLSSAEVAKIVVKVNSATLGKIAEAIDGVAQIILGMVLSDYHLYYKTLHWKTLITLRGPTS